MRRDAVGVNWVLAVGKRSTGSAKKNGCDARKEDERLPYNCSLCSSEMNQVKLANKVGCIDRVQNKAKRSKAVRWAESVV